MNAVISLPKKDTISLICLIMVATFISMPSYSQAKDSKDIEVYWIEKGALNRIFYSRKGPESWGAKQEVIRSKQPLTSLAVGTTKSGSRVLVWSEFSEGKVVLKQIQRMVDSLKWGRVSEITSVGSSNTSALLLRGTDGVMKLVWTSDRAGLDDIYLSSDSGTGWTRASKVNEDNDVPDISPTGSINEEGDIELNWFKYDRALRVYSSESATLKTTKELTQGRHNAFSLLAVELSQSKLQFPSWISANVSAVLHFPSHYYIQSVRNSD